MTISDAELDHLAALARLDLAEEERDALRHDLNAILGYFEQLEEIDTEGVDELVRPLGSAGAFRDDAPRPCLEHRRAMALAVEEQDGFFKVPRTVDENG